jgi:hypothetical protein
MAAMSKPILSQVARDSAESARRRLGEAAHPTAAEVQGLLELHHLLTDLLHRSWESAKAAMGEGVEAIRLRAMLEPVRDGAIVQLDMVPHLRNLAGAMEVPLANLEEDAETLRGLRDGAIKLLDWLAAPRPPIDQERLAQARQDVEQGRCETGESILARLRAGEDV